MKRDFVTIFDSNYIGQGLTMLRSLLRTTPEARVWAVTADDWTRRILQALGESRIETVALEELETPELRSVRPTRSRVEYYWTLTPFLPDFVFRNSTDSSIVTYVDADMHFRKSAHTLLDEFVGNEPAAVMVTPHDYLPKYDQSQVSGKYCVQFMPFRRTSSQAVLEDWQAKCIDWCFSRPQAGKFGDQKYLDAWPEQFGQAIHIQRNTTLLAAPWNARARAPHDIVAYHFHGLRRVSRRWLALHPGYSVPAGIRDAIYAPYILELAGSLRAAQELAPVASRVVDLPSTRALGVALFRYGPARIGLSRIPEIG